MRNGNSSDAARIADIGEGGFIEQADAIPQKIALLCLNQKSSLSYAEARLDGERRQIRLFLPDDGVMAGTQLFQRGPLLPVQPDVLTFVLADRATLRKCGRLGKLRAARDADRFHGSSLARPVGWILSGLLVVLQSPEIPADNGQRPEMTGLKSAGLVERALDLMPRFTCIQLAHSS